MMILVILNSMVAGILLYTAYQFLFIGLRNKKTPEYIILGIMVVMQSMCVLIELFGLLSNHQSSYLFSRLSYYNITAVINCIFFFFIHQISGYRYPFLKWVYLGWVFLTFILNNTVPYIIFNNQAHHYFLEILEPYYIRSWHIYINPIFGLIFFFQYIILIIFSILAFLSQQSIDKENAYFILNSSLFFIIGSACDLIIDFGIIHYPISSYFYMILIIYISNRLYKSIEKAYRYKDDAGEIKKKLRMVIDLVPNTYIKDLNVNPFLANNAIGNFYDTPSDKLLGNPSADFFYAQNESALLRQKDKDSEIIRSDNTVLIPEGTVMDRNRTQKIFRTLKLPFLHYVPSKAVLESSIDIAGFKKSEPISESNELLLATIFENASVAMILINKNAEVLKINKAGRSLGFNPVKDPIDLSLCNAINCVSAHFINHECEYEKDCNTCPFLSSIKSIFTHKNNLNRIPFNTTLRQENAVISYNMLLSTTFIENDKSPMALLVIEDITSITKAEKALIDSEQRYKQITHAITDYIYTIIIQDNGEILTKHSSVCFTITGYQDEEFEANPSLWFDIIIDGDREKVISFIQKIEKAPGKQTLEHRITHKDKTERWVSNTLVFKRKEENGDFYFDGIISDITKRKHTEEALEHQNKLLNTMLDNLPIGIFMVSAMDNTSVIYNKHAVKLLGPGILDESNMQNILNTFKQFKAGTNQPYPAEELPINRGMHGNYCHIDDMEVERPDGTRILLEAMGSPIYDASNNIWGSLVGFYDITDRKHTENALRESEKKLHLILEYSHVGVSLIDNTGKIEYMNPAFCKLLDYQYEQVIGENFQLFTDPKEIDEEMNLFNNIRENHLGSMNLKKKYTRKNGSEIWVQMHVSSLRNAKEEVTKFIAVVEDITEHQKALDLLQASEKKFRNIFNTSQDAILIVDFEGHILEANQVFIDRRELTKAQIKKMLFIKLVAPNDRKEALIQLTKLTQNKSAFFQTSFKNKKGEKIYVEIRGNSIKYNGKEVALLVSRDITERVLMHQRILNAIIEAEEKERSFFSQELHDGIGPLLSTIKLYMQWIQNPKAKSNKVALLTDALNTIEEALVSVKEISNRLSPNILSRFGLEAAIQSFTKKISTFEKVSFTLNINLPVRIRAEIETMLYRVSVEAITNSLKYANASNITLQIDSGLDGIRARFHDNGIGFNTDEILNKNSGNGLFNMQNRVETYEGYFSLNSKQGSGTEIVIFIPLNKKTNQA